MIRGILFDLGHTIWDIGHDDGGLLRRAYADMHAELRQRRPGAEIPAADALREAVRSALVRAMETYFAEAESVEQPPTQIWVDEGCRSLGLCLTEEELRDLTPPLFATEIDSLICADGTVDALRDLHGAGYALGCITNTLADLRAIRAMLRRYEIEDLMRCVVVSSEEGYRKPHTGLFGKALSCLGLPASEVVFVGDSPRADIAGAHAAGMRAVLTQQYVRRPLDGIEPDAIIQHLSELPEVIATLSARQRERN